MQKDILIGRERECQRLNRCMQSDRAQLIVVYGRRRVGKTYLINQYFDNKFSFKLVGAFDKPKSVQLKNFSNELKRVSGKPEGIPRDWVDAFEQLRNYLESKISGEKLVVFFDEMPWLDTKKSGFLDAFEYFWNSWASTVNNLVFIVCGSATSWIVDNITCNKGGLFNRLTCRIFLEPFSLCEVEQYLRSREIFWARYDIAECYMIMGGIPYYLSLLAPELTLSQNIDNLFFRNNSELWDEFDHLYHTLFVNGDSYIKVAQILSTRLNGLSRNEIARLSKIPANGALTKILKNLLDSGFIRVNRLFGNKKNNNVYQLSDYYSWFYFRFLRERYGKDENFWSNSYDNPSRRVWAGLMFEQLCKDHIRQIKWRLGIAGVLSEESVWYSHGDKSESPDKQGAQIDLLIDRRDHVVNICEIKFYSDEFEIDRDYNEKLRRKITAFSEATGCKKSIQMTMITTYGVKKGMYSGTVQKNVVLEDLFSAGDL